MIEYWKALAWGGGLLASFFGWGTVLAVLLWRGRWVPVCRRAVWGMAAVIGVGGVMNLCKGATREGIFWLIAAGWLPAVWGVWAGRARVREIFGSVKKGIAEQKGGAILVGVCAVLLGLRVGSSVVVANLYMPTTGHDEMRFNWHDDMQAYLVYPYRMLQTGEIGVDSFNSRRNQVSVGAAHLVNALMFAELGEDYVHFFESGLALLLVCGLVWELGGVMKLRWVWRGWMMLYVLCVLFFNANLTSYMSGAAFFLALLCTMMSEEWRALAAWRVGAVMGILAGAMVAMKTTFVPPVGILLAVYGVWRWMGKERARTVGIYAVMALAMGAVLLPWMLDMRKSAGTAFYPILGRGFHGSTYGKVPLPGTDMSAALKAELWTLAAWPLLVAAAAGIFLRRISAMRREWIAAMVAVLAAWGVGMVAIGINTGYGAGVERYLFSVSLAGQVMMLAGVFVISQERWPKNGEPLKWAGIGPAVACVFLLYRALDAGQIYGAVVPMNWRASFGGSLASHEWRRGQMQRMQAAVPAGATMLVRVSHPYVMNFERQKIFVADWPGDFSPPPGLPLGEGSEKLAAYLEGQAVRYVAYSYKSEAFYSRAMAGFRLSPQTPAWDRVVTADTFDFQDNLAELGKTRMKLYDDGDLFVIDLRERAAAEAPRAVAKR